MYSSDRLYSLCLYSDCPVPTGSRPQSYPHRAEKVRFPVHKHIALYTGSQMAQYDSQRPKSRSKSITNGNNCHFGRVNIKENAISNSCHQPGGRASLDESADPFPITPIENQGVKLSLFPLATVRCLSPTPFGWQCDHAGVTVGSE
jgi:hypothetical protein